MDVTTGRNTEQPNQWQMARFRDDGTMYWYEDVVCIIKCDVVVQLAKMRSKEKMLVVVPSQTPLIFCIRKQVLFGEADINTEPKGHRETHVSWLEDPGSLG
eukprot:2222272-Ditylum_brightwellii.AAC.1